ncbi:MAG: MotA/TolQ/ExbB proton channel family protein [Eubacteriales bacterium]|nr:MotA/TolQ/ExbB proton channel family protein [Eubacteriales bacterium]
MSGKKWYEALLLIVFIAMLALCVALNLTSGQRETISNIAVNAVMFIIVAIIFFTCWKNSFRPMGEIIDDLDAATERIRSDARDSHEYLWAPYINNKVELFKNDRLRLVYRDFLFELNHYSESKKAYYKCDIEDYVNSDLVDSVMHRGQLNQVAGALTGLGILGTFIGLSLGLQSFNTGTTAEITNSIEPLMDGIKVAFHTSIYGMIFSLVFNYAYKRRLYDAETTVAEFVSTFRKYVLPDTSNDGINLLIQAQQEQVEAINNMSVRMAEEVGRVIDPQFKKLTALMHDFTAVQTEQQEEALKAVVSAFIAEMNKSLAGSFTKLQDIISAQYVIQQKNAETMEAVLNETRGGVGSFSEINRRTSDLISTIGDYADSVSNIQGEIRRSIANVSAANDAQSAAIEETKNQLKVEKELLMGLQGSLTGFSKQIQDSNKDTADAVETMTDAIDDLRSAMEKLTKRSRG